MKTPHYYNKRQSVRDEDGFKLKELDPLAGL